MSAREPAAPSRPTEQSLTQRTVSGLVWLSSGKAAYAVMQLLVLAILGRLLTPADFGVISAALVVIAFSGIVSQLGLGPALVQRIELEPRHVRTAFAASLVLGVLLGGLIWISAPLAAGFFHSPPVEAALQGLALVFPLQGLGIVAESLARRDLQFRWLAKLDVKAYSFGFGLVALPLALAEWGVWALILGQIAETAVRTTLLLARFRPPRSWVPERQALAELMYFGGGFTVAKIANFFAVRGDNLLVGHLLGPAALGIYGRAYQLMAAPAASFGTVLDQVLFPAMARVQTDRARVAGAYRRGLTVMALVILPVSSAAVLLAPEIILVLLGPRWGEAVAPFQVLAVAMVFQNNSKIGDALARAMGAVYRRAWRQVLYAAAVVAGAAIGQRWGVVGVAYGVTLAIALNFAFMTSLSLRLTGGTWATLLRAHAPGAMVAATSSLLVWLGATGLRSVAAPPVVVLGLSLALATAGAGALVWQLPQRFFGADAAWIVDTLRKLRPAGGGRSQTSSPAALAYKTQGVGGMPR